MKSLLGIGNILTNRIYFMCNTTLAMFSLFIFAQRIVPCRHFMPKTHIPSYHKLVQYSFIHEVWRPTLIHLHLTTSYDHPEGLNSEARNV